MKELLWFLLPVAAASGWFACKANERKEDLAKIRVGILPKYLTGLDFLLENKHDKATEIFIELVEVDSETVETHFVLGNLFRQKGEFGKAIRIHENIIRRSNLSNYYHVKSLFELGRDYFHAGIYDQAEKFFTHELLKGVDKIKLDAYNYLVSLYEIEKNWQKAIFYAEKLRKRNMDDYSNRISYYYCELAEQALQKSDYNSAKKLLKKADLNSDASMRIKALKGDIYSACGEVSVASELYIKAFSEHPKYAKFLLPKISKTLQKLNASEFSDSLKNLDPKMSSTYYLTNLFESLISAGRVDEVEKLFSDLASQCRAPLPVVKLYLEYKKNNDEINSDLISNVVRNITINESTDYLYQCVKCGFETHRLYWKCPSCDNWGVASPKDVFSLDDNNTVKSHGSA